jgi:hypothetical protein
LLALPLQGMTANATIQMKRFKFLNNDPRGSLLRVANLPDEVTFSDALQDYDLVY